LFISLFAVLLLLLQVLLLVDWEVIVLVLRRFGIYLIDG